MGPWPDIGDAYTCTSRESPVLSAWPWVPARSGDPAAGDRGGGCVGGWHAPAGAPGGTGRSAAGGGLGFLQPHWGVSGLSEF